MRTCSATLLTALAVVCSTRASLAAPGDASRGVPSVVFVSGSNRLTVELPHDGEVHFEFAPATARRRRSIRTTPMVVHRRSGGATRMIDDGHGRLETSALRLEVDAQSLCMTVTDLTHEPATSLTTLCPEALGNDHNVLTVARAAMQNLYGLGEHFLTAGETNGDLLGRVIGPGTDAGNALTPFNGGFTGNAQFPVAYALGSAGAGYALFLDQLEAQTWDFTGDPWHVTMAGDAIRGYLIAGAAPAELRRRYMALVGRPPVPPKKAFGLWVSEFGYDSWTEIEDKLRTLRAQHIPVDGFVLDLQWFGGVFQRPSHMGALTWDTKAFPDPRRELARLRREQGIGLILIEEPYVDASRPEFATLAARGYLPRACDGCGPVSLASWWGTGSMLDWTNVAAADYWHDHKRQPLVEMGILGHWTDLGEPDDFSPDARYRGFPARGLHAERDVHDVYNLKWLASIARGYARHGNARRPFMLSRSGTSGIQRFGAAMWSGDIASNLSSLATHLNVQTQMSFAGVDYFGADVGGYWHTAPDGDPNERYTVWLANAALLDVPLRPHTQNLCNCYETAPDRIGDLAGNRDNVRLRYRLIPYLYSLAHRAHRYGEPVAPPLPLYYPDDPTVRTMADEKLLGHDLLVATVSAYGQTRRDVYLPAGSWIDFRTRACVRSAGEWVRDVPTAIDGTFGLPLFARAGSIIPEMYVDDRTMNALGARQDGRRHDELIVGIYAHDPVPPSQSRARPDRSRFTLYEDDGETTAYLGGAVRTTEITQERSGNGLRIAIRPARGTYAQAPQRRDNVVQLVLCGARVAGVSLNGVRLARRSTSAEVDGRGGWYDAGDGPVRNQSGAIDVRHAKRFLVRLTDP